MDIHTHNAGIAVTLELLLNAGKKLSEIAHGDADFSYKNSNWQIYFVLCSWSFLFFMHNYMICTHSEDVLRCPKCPNMKDLA